MKRARSSEGFLGVSRLRARRGLAPLLAAAAFAYLLFVSVKLAGLRDMGPAPAVGRRLATAGAGAGGPLRRRADEPPARVGGGGVSGYGRITGEILRRRQSVHGERRKRWGRVVGNFTELERVAAEAWTLGAAAWEEASAFAGDVDSIASRDDVAGDREGAAAKCPGSLALGAGETAAAFLPCGLAAGSAVTVVGTARAARPEYVEALERSGAGNGTVLVAQFAVELRGLRAADGEEPPRTLHLNPQLRGDWSGRPVLDMNTCFQMKWGRAQRCDGTHLGRAPTSSTLRRRGQPQVCKWLFFPWIFCFHS